MVHGISQLEESQNVTEKSLNKTSDENSSASLRRIEARIANQKKMRHSKKDGENFLSLKLPRPPGGTLLARNESTTEPDADRDSYHTRQRIGMVICMISCYSLKLLCNWKMVQPQWQLLWLLLLLRQLAVAAGEWYSQISWNLWNDILGISWTRQQPADVHVRILQTEGTSGWFEPTQYACGKCILPPWTMQGLARIMNKEWMF